MIFGAHHILAHLSMCVKNAKISTLVWPRALLTVLLLVVVGPGDELLLLVVVGPGDDFNNHPVSWSQFNREPLQNRNFTFWEWFYSIVKLTKDWLAGPWKQRYGSTQHTFSRFFFFKNN